MSRMYESISLINLVIAHSWFVIIFLSNLVEAIWYSNLLIRGPLSNYVCWIIMEYYIS